MKKVLVAVVAVCVAGLVAMAATPVRVTGTVATAGTAFDVPSASGMAFRMEHAIFAAAAGTTQTVALIHGSVTNQLATKVVSATDRMLSVTNGPWLFAGDKVLVTTTATNAYSAVFLGVTQD